MADKENGTIGLIIRTGMLAILIGFFAYLFNEVQAIPKRYVTKDELRTVVVSLKTDFDRIEKKIDNINTYLLTMKK